MPRGVGMPPVHVGASFVYDIVWAHGIREGEKQTYHVGLRNVTCLMARLLFGWLWPVVFLRWYLIQQLDQRGRIRPRTNICLRWERLGSRSRKENRIYNVARYAGAIKTV